MDSALQDAPNKRDNKQALFQLSSSATNESTSLSTALPLNSQSTNLPSTPTTPGQQSGWPPVALDATARELWSPTTQIYARGWPTEAIPPSPLSFNDFRFIGDSAHPTSVSSGGGEFVTPSQPIQDATNPFFYQSAAGGFPPGAETTSLNASLSSGDSQWQMYLTGSFSNPLDLNALDFRQPNDSVIVAEHQEGNYGPVVGDEVFGSSHIGRGVNNLGPIGDGMGASTGRSDGTTAINCSPVLRPQHQLLETSHEYHGSYLHSPPSESLPAAATASAMPVVSASSSAHHRHLGEGSLPQTTQAFPFISHSTTSPQSIANALAQQRFGGRGPSGSLLRFAQHGVAQGQLSPSQQGSYLQHLPLRLRAPTPLEAPAVPRHSRMTATRTGVGSTIRDGPAHPVTPPATDVGSPPIPRQLFVASTSTGVGNSLPSTTYRRGLSGWGTTGNSPPTSQVVRQNPNNPPRGRKRQQAPNNMGPAAQDFVPIASYVAPFNALTERPSTTSRRPSSSNVSLGGIDLDVPEQLPPRRSKFRKVSHRESSDDDYEPADDGDSDSDCYLPSRSPSPEYPATSSNEHRSRTVDSNKGSVISRNYSSTKRRKQGKARGSAALALAVVSQMAQETAFDHSSIDLETHPGIRKRKNHPIPLPVPVPNLNKKSRGRKVPYVVDLSSPGQGGSDVGTTDYVQGHAETPSASSPKVDDDMDEVDEEYATSGQGSVRPSSRRKGSTPAPVLVDGERTYVCVVAGCGKCFVRGEHLKRHVRSIHTHDKPHKCPYHGCGKSFSRRDNLGQHTRIHIQTGV